MIDTGFIRIESIASYQDDEFDVRFPKDESVINISLQRLNPRTDAGTKILTVVHDKFSTGEYDLGIGEFEFQSVELLSIENEDLNIDTINGSYMVVTDFNAYFNLQLVSGLDQLPLSDFSIYQMGFKRAPNLFGHLGEIVGLTTTDGYISLYFPPDPSHLYFEESNCYKPQEGVEIIFIIRVEPPLNSVFETQIYEIPVKPVENCGSFENFFEEKTLSLFPKTQLINWYLYE